jgi:hypothetical protein
MNRVSEQSEAGRHRYHRSSVFAVKRAGEIAVEVAFTVAVEIAVAVAVAVMYVCSSAAFPVALSLFQ